MLPWKHAADHTFDSITTTMAAVEAHMTNGTNGTNGNGALQDGAEGATTATPAIPFDPTILHTYLLALLPPLLGALPEELDAIFDEEFDERVTRFAGENGGVMYIVKKKGEVEGEQTYRNVAAPTD